MHRLTPDNASTHLQRFALRLLAIFGWHVDFAPLPGPRGVIIVYPHTSNWDFIVGLLAKWGIGEPLRWLGKESLFSGITGATLGRLMRLWGGEPIERRASTGAIERLAQRMHAADHYWLALAPEGTRKYRDNWRSGFYHIALAAKVPLGIAYIDYATKVVGLVDYLTLVGNTDSDLAVIREIYRERRGLKHYLAAPITLQMTDSAPEKKTQ